MVRNDYLLLKQQLLHGKKPDDLLQQTSDDVSEDSSRVHMVETRLYVGLNDSQTKKQMFETEQYRDQLKELCFKYHVPFSIDTEEGGYFHDDGEYVEENTLVLTLIDTDKDIIENIAKDLCALFNQESVLVTEDEVKGYYIT